MVPKVKDELDEAYEDPVFLDEDGGGDGVHQGASGSQVLGGLVLLQALTNSSSGQQYVLSQAHGLIGKVCELAASQDEALRSGALQIIGGWILNQNRDLKSAVMSHDIASLCLGSIDHASLAVRRNAAQLLAVVDIEKVEPRLLQLADDVMRNLAASEQSSPYPIMVGFHSSPASSTEMVAKRRLILGFIEVIRALAEVIPSPHPLLRPQCIETMITIFSCAWNLPISNVDSSHIYWLQDHQIRESSLDALVDLLRSTSWSLASEECFVKVYKLVMSLLGKAESVGHTRAALALLGAVNIPHEAKTLQSLSPLSILLDLISEIFDAAWLSEHREEEEEAKSKGTSLHQVNTGSTQEGPILSPVDQIPLLLRPPVDQSSFHLSSKPLIRVEEGLGYRIILQVMQAWRQIFSRCRNNQTLLDHLDKTRWMECLTLASKHSRHQVSSAAIDLQGLTKKGDVIESNVIDTDLLLAFADAEQGPEIIDLKPSITDDELKEVFKDDPNNDPDMIDFLRSFLDASLTISGEENRVSEVQENRVSEVQDKEGDVEGMFKLVWPDARVEENVAKEIEEAMKLLPNADRKRECMKYEMIFK